MLFAGEVATAQELAYENGEPDFNLINPGCVLGREMKNDTMPSRRNASRAFIEASTPDLPFSPRSSVMPLSRATS